VICGRPPSTILW
jgi:hypothetical protein